jgi:hypothetical protein
MLMLARVHHLRAVPVAHVPLAGQVDCCLSPTSALLQSTNQCVVCTCERTQVGTYDYAGCMTLPCLLHLVGDKLVQWPAPCIQCS